METTEYQKLPGTGLRRVGIITLGASRTRLYVAADHLLSMDSMFGSETYKRFYFRDIQAFVVRRTPSGSIALLVFGGLLALSGLGLLSANPIAFGFGTVFTVLFSVIFLTYLIQQLGWGDTCRTWVQTAVQTEELPSLSRAKTCHQVLARLQPLVLAAQPAPPPTTGAPAAESPAPAGAPRPDAVPPP